MKIHQPELVKLLKQAYSAERAAALAYVGHAGAVTNPAEKSAIRQIELDEWGHREHLLAIMDQYEIPVSKYYEILYYVIGRIISASCYLIGWFMPFYFAGRLESGNVCEYFRMMQLFNSLGIEEHDAILYEMGIKEKEHEVYFLDQIKTKKQLPLFEKLFHWGIHKSRNNVHLEEKRSLRDSGQYCQKPANRDTSGTSVGLDYQEPQKRVR